MSAEAFRLLRTIAPEGPNDMFIVGDAHQRIYRHRVSLGQCLINIKGRGRKLKLNYRTTDEIRKFAVGLLEGKEFDDLDDGKDQQRGYVSITHGRPPLIRQFATLDEEIAFLKTYIAELQKDDASPESICVFARTKRILETYISQLQSAGFATYEIKRNAAEQRDKPRLRMATIHRVKELEFEHICVVTANKGIIPFETAVDDAEDAVAKLNAETRERSLLYVAVTRARKSATITGRLRAYESIPELAVHHIYLFCEPKLQTLLSRFDRLHMSSQPEKLPFGHSLSDMQTVASLRVSYCITSASTCSQPGIAAALAPIHIAIISTSIASENQFGQKLTNVAPSDFRFTVQAPNNGGQSSTVDSMWLRLLANLYAFAG